jgi:hypothetical protein
LATSGFRTVYTPATVNQIRNPHALETDIKNELWGYFHIESLVDDLCAGKDILDISLIPSQTKVALDQWRKAIDKI